MAVWDDPVDSQTDPDAPITSGLGKRWDNNVIAALELNASAPKMKVSVEADTAGGVVDPTVIDGLANFDGAIIEGFVANLTSGACNIDIDLSNDGITYSPATTLISIATSFNGSFKLFVNLFDGTFKGAYQGGTNQGLSLIHISEPTRPY